MELQFNEEIRFLNGLPQSPLFFYHSCQVLGVFAKFQKATIIIVMSVCPHETTRLPTDGFSWNLIYENFSKIY
jgi:hypothetical protein